jgi:hypothetical protein
MFQLDYFHSLFFVVYQNMQDCVAATASLLASVRLVELQTHFQEFREIKGLLSAKRNNNNNSNNNSVLYN